MTDIKMGHEEEDKELMMIRMETLKSMIGKLKNKTSKGTARDNVQVSGEKYNIGKDKTFTAKATLTSPSSPMNFNRSPNISNPSSPLSINSNKSNILTTLIKSKSLQNHVHQSSSTNQLSNHNASSAAIKTDVVPMKPTPSVLVHQSPYKVSYQTYPKSNLPTHMNVSVSKNELPSVSDPYRLCKTSVNSYYPSLKSFSSTSKSFSDSEISSRKSLFDHSTSKTNTAYKSPSYGKNDGPFGSTSSLSSQSPSKFSLNNVTSTNCAVPVSTLKVKPVLNHEETLTKPVTKLLKNSHTLTKPLTEEITKTRTDTMNANQVCTNSINSLKKQSSQQPGKILFERTGKVLFDRHSSQQNRSFANHNRPFALNKTHNFAREFKLIRNKHTAVNVKSTTTAPHKLTTRTKFYASDYVAQPETCEKARTILSKYKVVRNKNNSHGNPIKKDINANYPTVPSIASLSSTAPCGRILYEKPKSFGRGRGVGGYRGAYSKKGRVFYPTGKIPCLNFVSRRLKYIRSVVPNPYAVQPVKPSMIANKNTKREIILSRHGTNYQVAGNLKSLRRLSANQGNHLKYVTPSKQTTHYLKTQLSKTGVSPKNVTARQYLASQVLKKTRLSARKKVEKEKEFCIFFNRYGKCKRGEKCHFIHDPDKIAICTRFLRGTCKDEGCLFSHKLDPDKMPVCSYFLRGECGRDDCPYRHVNVGESASVCDDFLKGYCPKGKECVKKHILECEEFSNTGTCSNRKTCNLTHRHDKPRKRKYSGSRPPKGFRPKRKRSESQGDSQLNELVDGGKSARPKEGKKHMLPRFVSDNIKLLRESASEKPTSFSGLKKFYETTKNEKEISKKTTDDLWGSDFIPISNYSGGESDDENSEFIQRMFTFKK